MEERKLFRIIPCKVENRCDHRTGLSKFIFLHSRIWILLFNYLFGFFDHFVAKKLQLQTFPKSIHFLKYLKSNGKLQNISHLGFCRSLKKLRLSLNKLL
jgi:hypothetical protein